MKKKIKLRKGKIVQEDKGEAYLIYLLLNGWVCIGGIHNYQFARKVLALARRQYVR